MVAQRVRVESRAQEKMQLLGLRRAADPWGEPMGTPAWQSVILLEMGAPGEGKPWQKGFFFFFFGMPLPHEDRWLPKLTALQRAMWVRS